MPNTPALPTGRPPLYVKGRDGKPIVGLSRSSQGRYYATHSRPRITFGRDFDSAVVGFRQWEARQNHETTFLPVLQPLIAKHDQDECVAEGWITASDAARLVPWPGDVPTDAFFSAARQLLLSDPKGFAERVGIPEIAYLQELKPPPASPKLVDLGRLYAEKARITRHERQKSERYWAEFCRFTTCKLVRDISQDEIVKYYDWVISSSHSQTWKKHRLGKIKTILRFAQGRGAAPREIETLLSYCKLLIPPRRNTADPRPISRAHYRALLDAADSHWCVILLTLMNFCMYAKDLADLDWAEVDLEKCTLLTDRAKTGVPRIAALWPRTAEALRAAPRAAGQISLFVNAAGTRYHPDHLRRGFGRLRVVAGIPDTVKISDIRDGAYSAALEAGADLTLAKLLAGHQTGVTDYYVQRNPRMVAGVCRSIEEHYFGPAPKSLSAAPNETA